MSNYLFLFTIGPVQSFIAQARKTQDLYAGSKLLSDLIGEAIKHLPDGSDVIFPDKASINNPNRFIAKISSDDIKSVRDELPKKIQNTFKDIAKGSYSKVFGNTEISPKYEKQIDTFLQIYWTAKTLDNYQNDYLELERHLGSVKNFRAFKQLDEEAGRKCSLCGERSVQVFKKNSDSESQGKYPKEAKEIQNFSYLFNPGEGLCAVCFTKRFYQYKKNTFDSTADVAVANIISHLQKDPKGSLVLNNYKSFFDERLFDGQLFFEENLTQKCFEKHELGLPALSYLKNKSIQVSYEEIKKFISKKVIFSPYYAVLAFDGDNMGKHLSGDFLRDKSKLEEYHNLLSNVLGNFSLEVKKYIDSNNAIGQAIYAGGDDFLGLFNLPNLLDTIEKIQELFSKHVNESIKIQQGDTLKEELTFSAGIAIAHYKTPLSETLNWARKMEKEAKKVEGKNAFAIAALKHSGEINSFKMRWRKGEFDTIQFLKTFLNLLKKEVFSTTFIKKLYNEFSRLIDKKDSSKPDEKIVIAEIKRLLDRSFIPTEENNQKYPKDKDGNRTVISETTDGLITLYRNKVSIENYFSLLNIVDFIHRKVY